MTKTHGPSSSSRILVPAAALVLEIVIFLNDVTYRWGQASKYHLFRSTAFMHARFVCIAAVSMTSGVYLPHRPGGKLLIERAGMPVTP